MEKFRLKLFMNANIKVLTGLHIGGSKENLDIGGLDNPVIKTVDGIPYLPGSSIKGKLRFLLEKANGIRESKTEGEPCGCGECDICLLFGPATSDPNKKNITRLCVRDSFLDIENFKGRFPELYKEKIHTEEKTENIIDRIKGNAQHPRTIERVLPGSIFNLEMTINFYENDNIDNLIKTFIQSLRLLEDEYLGGSGTRGYGKISFENLIFSFKSRIDYLTKNQKREIYKSSNLNFFEQELVKNLENNLKEVSNN